MIPSPAPCHVSDATALSAAASLIGKRGGRPKGSCSSNLAQWLTAEIRKTRRNDYRCREAFNILRDSEAPAGPDAFTVKDWTADDNELEPDIRVTWSYYRKIWQRTGRQKPVCVPLIRRL